jgi:predicted DNA-binding transcriptional regulator AlpA
VLEVFRTCVVISVIELEMTDMSTSPISKFWTKPNLAMRYGGKSTRTIDRWVEAGRFPPPDIRLPNGQPAWSDATIEQHELASVARA